MDVFKWQRISGSSASLQAFFKQKEAPRKCLFWALSGTLILLLLLFLGRTAERTLPVRRLVLAAGNETGSSYRFGRALKQVVEANSAIRIDVCATDGTDDNIRALERKSLLEEAVCLSRPSQPRQRLKADLITAQADRLYQALISQDEGSSTPGQAPEQPLPLPQASSATAIAVLFQDHFQLILNPKSFSRIDPEAFALSQLTGKTIGTPQAGGQRPSLKTLSDHFGFQFLSLDLNLSRQDSAQQCQRVSDLDAVFRVRRLGNSEIRRFIQCGWRPVAIPQAEALQNSHYPAVQAAKIPQGIYQGEPPIPPTDLDTIAIDRLLIAHEGVPNWVVETITGILFEHQQALRDAIIELSKVEPQFDPETVVPLVDNIAKPGEDAIVQLHPGAMAFFTPFELPFVVENADFGALLVSLGVLAYSAYVQLKNLRANAQIKTLLERLKPKDFASAPKKDSALEQATEAAQIDPKKDPQKPKLTPDDLTKDLERLFTRHRLLDEDFQHASKTLDHEGFRAFSEAYKSAREMIEREIEDRQRRFSSIYVDQVVRLLTQVEETGQAPGEQEQHLKRLSKALDLTFIKASQKLTQEDIFSRESFRTFTEAYDIARETLERKMRE